MDTSVRITLSEPVEDVIAARSLPDDVFSEITMISLNMKLAVQHFITFYTLNDAS